MNNDLIFGLEGLDNRFVSYQNGIGGFLGPPERLKKPTYHDFT